MDMDTGSMSMADSQTPLTATGVDFSNATQANDFLSDLLDDTTLQVTGNQYARYFWYGVVVVIGIASGINIFRTSMLATRRRQAARGCQDAARPKNILMRWSATATAIARETAYAQFTPSGHPLWFRLPPLGTVLLLLGYLGFVLGLEFVDRGGYGAQYQQQLGVRAAWLAIAQVPLLILLVGKNNIIGLMTGISYERLNVLHRWVARVLLLLATLHFGYQGYGWSKFPGIFTLEWTTDSCVPTGLATYVILIWMNISTLAPVRNLCYEFFVIQHIITFFGFIIAIMFHLPSTALYSRVYIYIPIAFYLVDRLTRTVRYAYNNSKLTKATLTKMDGGVTRIRLHNPRIKSWTPGAHVLIAFPSISLGQSHHPATIASIPQSHGGDIVLILKSQKGFTKQLLTHANDSSTSLLTDDKPNNAQQPEQQTHKALLDGPYGGKHADFAAFDSVCLIAGSTGVSFMLPILLDIAARATLTRGKLPVRRMHLVWCIKQLGHAKWVQTELATAFAQLRAAGVDAQVSFYVTCADTYTMSGDAKECPCACDKSLGPCCCINPEDLEREKEIVGPLVGGASSLSPESSSSATAEKHVVAASTSAASVASASAASEDLPTPASTRATVFSGRPQLSHILEEVLHHARGESGVAVCGPLGMSAGVRNAVVELSDRRAVHKGTGAQGVYLHVEGFCS